MPASWGSTDFSGLARLRDRLGAMEETELDRFCRIVSKELAARLLRLVIHTTPIGEYPEKSGKNGGTLRRGWTARTGQGASPGGRNAEEYAAGLPVTKSGGAYTVEVVNPVEYASYVEYGHRTRGGDGWVNGKYFLTLAENDLRAIAPALLEKRLEDLLREVFSDG